jgi:hypothetical protein
MKPDEILLRGSKKESDEGVNLTKIYHKYICKYHNAFSIQLLHVNKTCNKKEFRIHSHTHTHTHTHTSILSKKVIGKGCLSNKQKRLSIFRITEIV